LSENINQVTMNQLSHVRPQLENVRAGSAARRTKFTTDTGKLRTIARLSSLGRTPHQKSSSFELSNKQKTLADPFARVVSFVSHMSTVMTTSLMAVGIVSLAWFAFAIVRHVRRRRHPQLGVVSEEWLTLHRADRW
jgi:hypothetical protein